MLYRIEVGVDRLDVSTRNRRQWIHMINNATYYVVLVEEKWCHTTIYTHTDSYQKSNAAVYTTQLYNG